MRRNIKKKNSTKHERIFYELLKKHKIPFKHRWLVDGREIDFIVGEYAIEINGHEQDEQKTIFLIEHGFVPIHIPNEQLENELINLETWLVKIPDSQMV